MLTESQKEWGWKVTPLYALTSIQASRDDEVERIIAWLRSLAGEFVTPPILAFFGDPFKRDGQLLCVEIADAIERGDYRTQGEVNEDGKF